MDTYDDDDQIMLIVAFSNLRSVKNRFLCSGFRHVVAVLVIEFCPWSAYLCSAFLSHQLCFYCVAASETQL